MNFAGTGSRISLHPLSSSRRVIPSQKIALNSNGEVNYRELARSLWHLSLNPCHRPSHFICCTRIPYIRSKYAYLIYLVWLFGSCFFFCSFCLFFAVVVVFVCLFVCFCIQSATFLKVPEKKKKKQPCLGLGRSKSKAAHLVIYFPRFLCKNIKNCPPSKHGELFFTSLALLIDS